MDRKPRTLEDWFGQEDDFEMNNLERYKEDLERLIQEGEMLYYSMKYECNPRDNREAIETTN